MDGKQLELFPNAQRDVLIDDWTFAGASTREHSHCYHDYPARMIPQISRKLLDLYGDRAKLLFDPYCGTGTSLVEAILRGVDAIGTDLNPLARLITSVKTTTYSETAINEGTKHLLNAFSEYRPIDVDDKVIDVDLKNLRYWFTPEVISTLFYIRNCIDTIKDVELRRFFHVVFSETTRRSSNTRTGEFKLYRMPEHKLKYYSPNVFAIFKEVLYRNKSGCLQYLSLMRKQKRQGTARILSFNTVEGIPDYYVASSSVDIVITSPPYGDSRTTVAYGQYSQLSAAWLGFKGSNTIDKQLMGGQIKDRLLVLPSESLYSVIGSIQQKDGKRASEVFAFYDDLYQSIRNVANVVRSGGYICYVVGNRKVKGIVLPTDKIVQEFFEKCNCSYVTTHTRAIPNKRMPSRNSPTNIPGKLDDTMTREYIVVMRKD